MPSFRLFFGRSVDSAALIVSENPQGRLCDGGVDRKRLPCRDQGVPTEESTVSGGPGEEVTLRSSERIEVSAEAPTNLLEIHQSPIQLGSRENPQHGHRAWTDLAGFVTPKPSPFSCRRNGFWARGTRPKPRCPFQRGSQVRRSPS